ncbi:hypothetical protein C8J57DRAFT_1541967 [Mycena rebaudengoi]|nr:hypothetical protein C8J57DRAFT_1541967 [Mycena rebaudengoi]
MPTPMLMPLHTTPALHVPSPPCPPHPTTAATMCSTPMPTLTPTPLHTAIHDNVPAEDVPAPLHAPGVPLPMQPHNCSHNVHTHTSAHEAAIHDNVPAQDIPMPPHVPGMPMPTQPHNRGHDDHAGPADVLMPMTHTEPHAHANHVSANHIATAHAPSAFRPPPSSLVKTGTTGLALDGPRHDAAYQAAFAKLGARGSSVLASSLQVSRAGSIPPSPASEAPVYFNKEKLAVYKNYDVGFKAMGDNESLQMMTDSEVKGYLEKMKPNNLLSTVTNHKPKNSSQSSSSCAAAHTGYNPSDLPSPPRDISFNMIPPVSREVELEHTIVHLNTAILAQQGSMGSITQELEKKEGELVVNIEELWRGMRGLVVEEDEDLSTDAGLLRIWLRRRAEKNSRAHRCAVMVEQLKKTREASGMHASDAEDSEMTTDVMAEELEYCELYGKKWRWMAAHEQ